MEIPLDAPSDEVPENDPRRKGRKGSLRRSPDKKRLDEGEDHDAMDEDYEAGANSSRSTTDDEQSECEEVADKDQGTSKKYQRKERFLCGDDFEQLPLLRAFATGPSPEVKDREEPRAYFYCRICRTDISTDKTFSRTPQSLAKGHFGRDKHYLKDVKYRILKGAPAYHRDGTVMMQEEVAALRRTFDNTPPVIPDSHLYLLVGQSPNKNLVDICAEGPERQTISQINLVHRALKDGTTIASVEEILKHCLSRVPGSIGYDWSSPNLYVSVQSFVFTISHIRCTCSCVK